MAAEKPKTIRLADYRAPDFLVETIDLTFDLEPKATRVTARSAFQRNPAHKDGKRPLVLDGEAIKLVSLALDGKALAEGAYTAGDESLTVPDVPDAFELMVTTEIAPEANTRLEGLYLSSGIYTTQCEAEGFRRITYFPDRPDVMAKYRVTVRGDRKSCPVLLSNGNLVSARDLPDGRHEAVWEDPYPKPSYLFALVAGDLAKVEDDFTTETGREVKLRIFVEHGNEARCGFAMDALKRSMRWDEEAYGLAYDLDQFSIVAVSDFNMGAMENKGLNVFNAKYILADPETATDADYGFIETIVAHEYFHNWTGNRITCRDWFQLSLKEGLTVFRDQQFSETTRSQAVERISQVRSLRARQFPEDAGPTAHPVRPAEYIEINNFYTPTVYDKGAEVIRMMHTLLGRDGFRKGMDLYFERHDGQAVTCDDFVAAMEDANDQKLTLFRRWYGQAGTPVVTVTGKYDDLARAYEMTVAQETKPTPGEARKEPLHIPLAVGLMDRRGREMPLRFEGESIGKEAYTRVIELTEPSQTFRFLGVIGRPVPSINRGFSAPVRLEMAQSDEDLAFLMASDPDRFNRWEAGQRYATRLLLKMVEQARAGGEPEADSRFVDAIHAGLREEDPDRAFMAQMLALPSEDYLAEQMEVADPDAIHKARTALRRAVATRLTHDFLVIYRANRSNRAYVFDQEEAGRRALKNAALGYVAVLGDSAAVELAGSQYDDADNMTDRMAALAALNDLDVKDRRKVLDDFYGRFEKNGLVIDKWLSLEAMSALPGTLARVKELTAHTAFSIRNPNKVRALIGAFAAGNPVRFHAKDGAGYAFLADRVIELDKLNPQVAARMVAPLRRWRKFDAGRQAKMRAELERILAVPDLSRDVFEIASKSLA
ncbi:MAG: aminopeptidase N [Alphaproteobacteria bacterium]